MKRAPRYASCWLCMYRVQYENGMSTVSTEEPTVESTLSKEEGEQLGSALLESEVLLKKLNLPSMFSSITSFVNTFCKTDGREEETLDPFGAKFMDYVIEMAKTDNAKYHRIVEETFDKRERCDSTSILNRMEATISFCILMEKLAPVYKTLFAPDKPPAKKMKVDNEANQAA